MSDSYKSHESSVNWNNPHPNSCIASEVGVLQSAVSHPSYDDEQFAFDPLLHLLVLPCNLKKGLTLYSPSFECPLEFPAVIDTKNGDQIDSQHLYLKFLEFIPGTGRLVAVYRVYNSCNSKKEQCCEQECNQTVNGISQMKIYCDSHVSAPPNGECTEKGKSKTNPSISKSNGKPDTLLQESSNVSSNHLSGSKNSISASPSEASMTTGDIFMIWDLSGSFQSSDLNKNFQVPIIFESSLQVISFNRVSVHNGASAEASGQLKCASKSYVSNFQEDGDAGEKTQTARKKLRYEADCVKPSLCPYPWGRPEMDSRWLFVIGAVDGTVYFFDSFLCRICDYAISLDIILEQLATLIPKETMQQMANKILIPKHYAKTIALHPFDSSRFLIGYLNGAVIDWSLNKNCLYGCHFPIVGKSTKIISLAQSFTDLLYSSSKPEVMRIQNLCWHPSGNQFIQAVAFSYTSECPTLHSFIIFKTIYAIPIFWIDLQYVMQMELGNCEIPFFYWKSNTDLKSSGSVLDGLVYYCIKPTHNQIVTQFRNHKSKEHFKVESNATEVLQTNYKNDGPHMYSQTSETTILNDCKLKNNTISSQLLSCGTVVPSMGTNMALKPSLSDMTAASYNSYKPFNLFSPNAPSPYTLWQIGGESWSEALQLHIDLPGHSGQKDYFSYITSAVSIFPYVYRVGSSPARRISVTNCGQYLTDLTLPQSTGVRQEQAKEFPVSKAVNEIAHLMNCSSYLLVLAYDLQIGSTQKQIFKKRKLFGISLGVVKDVHEFSSNSHGSYSSNTTKSTAYSASVYGVGHFEQNSNILTSTKKEIASMLTSQSFWCDNYFSETCNENIDENNKEVLSDEDLAFTPEPSEYSSQLYTFQLNWQSLNNDVSNSILLISRNNEGGMHCNAENASFGKSNFLDNFVDTLWINRRLRLCEQWYSALKESDRDCLVSNQFLSNLSDTMCMQESMSEPVEQIKKGCRFITDSDNLRLYFLNGIVRPSQCDWGLDDSPYDGLFLTCHQNGLLRFWVHSRCGLFLLYCVSLLDLYSTPLNLSREEAIPYSQKRYLASGPCIGYSDFYLPKSQSSSKLSDVVGIRLHLEKLNKKMIFQTIAYVAIYTKSGEILFLSVSSECNRDSTNKENQNQTEIEHMSRTNFVTNTLQPSDSENCAHEDSMSSSKSLLQNSAQDITNTRTLSIDREENIDKRHVSNYNNFKYNNYNGFELHIDFNTPSIFGFHWHFDQHCYCIETVCFHIHSQTSLYCVAVDMKGFISVLNVYKKQIQFYVSIIDHCSTVFFKNQLRINYVTADPFSKVRALENNPHLKTLFDNASALEQKMVSFFQSPSEILCYSFSNQCLIQISLETFQMQTLPLTSISTSFSCYNEDDKVLSFEEYLHNRSCFYQSNPYELSTILSSSSGPVSSIFFYILVTTQSIHILQWHPVVQMQAAETPKAPCPVNKSTVVSVKEEEVATFHSKNKIVSRCSDTDSSVSSSTSPLQKLQSVLDFSFNYVCHSCHITCQINMLQIIIADSALNVYHYQVKNFSRQFQIYLINISRFEYATPEIGTISTNYFENRSSSPRMVAGSKTVSTKLLQSKFNNIIIGVDSKKALKQTGTYTNINDTLSAKEETASILTNDSQEMAGEETISSPHSFKHQKNGKIASSIAQTATTKFPETPLKDVTSDVNSEDEFTHDYTKIDSIASLSDFLSTSSTQEAHTSDQTNSQSNLTERYRDSASAVHESSYKPEQKFLTTYLAKIRVSSKLKMQMNPSEPPVPCSIEQEVMKSQKKMDETPTLSPSPELNCTPHAPCSNSSCMPNIVAMEQATSDASFTEENNLTEKDLIHRTTPVPYAVNVGHAHKTDILKTGHFKLLHCEINSNFCCGCLSRLSSISSPIPMYETYMLLQTLQPVAEYQNLKVDIAEYIALGAQARSEMSFSTGNRRSEALALLTKDNETPNSPFQGPRGLQNLFSTHRSSSMTLNNRQNRQNCIEYVRYSSRKGNSRFHEGKHVIFWKIIPKQNQELKKSHPAIQVPKKNERKTSLFKKADTGFFTSLSSIIKSKLERQKSSISKRESVLLTRLVDDTISNE